jgi:hypothetical protein
MGTFGTARISRPEGGEPCGRDAKRQAPAGTLCLMFPREHYELGVARYDNSTGSPTSLFGWNSL